MRNIAVFASGTGTNFIKIHEAILNREIDAKLNFFFSDKKNSQALKKANEFGLNTLALSLKDFTDKQAYEERILVELEKHEIDLIVLAGYMKIIGSTLLEKYSKKIINIHPSLLPAYRGKDAIIRQHANQEKKMGISIHYVDNGIDTGEIIFQKSINVEYPIKLSELETKIHEIEHKYYKAVINKLLGEKK